MSAFENKSYFKIKGSTERNFGLVLATFFMIICLYPVLKGESIRFWALSISIILYCLGLFLPKTLIVPNKLWFKFGMILGAIVAPIVMGLIFFLTVTPIGIIMRLLGKDILNQRIEKSAKSYWIKRKDPIGSMKNQF